MRTITSSLRPALTPFATAVFASIALLAATAAPAQAQFTGIYGFGDSYADTGAGPGGAFRLAGVTFCITNPSLCRFTGTTNFVESLQTTYRLPGLINYAIGGALTNDTNTLTGQAVTVPPPATIPPLPGLPYELARLAHDGVRFTDRDLIALTIGGNNSSLLTNDVSAATALGMAAAGRAVYGIGVAPINDTYDGVTYTNVVTHGVQQLVAAGAKNIAWLSAGNSKYFPEPEGGGAIGEGPRNAFATTYYQQIQTLLQPMAQSGVRIFLFDFETLQSRIAANPAQYGFSAISKCEANAAPGVPTPGITYGVANCFYYNSVHPTGTAMALIAAFMSNQIDAPTTVVPQGDITTGIATGFSTSVLGRLDAERTFQPIATGAAMAMSYAMPTKAPIEPFAPIPAEKRWSIYGNANYASGSRNGEFLAAAYDYNSVGGTVGVEYRVDRTWRVGGVFAYSEPNVSLGIQNAHNHVTAYQLAAYGTFTDTNWFADALVAYGRQDFSLDRQGVSDTIRGSTHANTFTAAARGGYLFDIGAVRAGPIAGLNYTHAVIDGYTENGDILLTMMVDRQALDALTGSAGLQVRYPFQWGKGIYNPFVNVTAEHDFVGSGRVVTTTQVTAPLLPVLTPVPDNANRTYGKVAAGIAAAVSGNLTATLTAATSFAREGGNDFGVSGGIKAAF